MKRFVTFPQLREPAATTSKWGGACASGAGSANLPDVRFLSLIRLERVSLLLQFGRDVFISVTQWQSCKSRAIRGGNVKIGISATAVYDNSSVVKQSVAASTRCVQCCVDPWVWRVDFAICWAISGHVWWLLSLHSMIDIRDRKVRCVYSHGMAILFLWVDLKWWNK